jgi:putative ABC transport system permease protein
MLQRLRLAARGLFNRTAVESELDEELRFHLEQQTQLFIARGMSSTDARRAALVALGGIEPTKEAQRQGRGSRAIEDVIADTKYAARALWHDKPLAIAGLATLALGIGATTAVFSAVNAAMLRDLPFGAPHQVVELWEENKARGWYKNVAAPANYLDWAEQNTTFSGIAGYTDYATNVTLLGEGEPRLLKAAYVTGNFVDVLQVKPALGRGFDDAETWDNGQRRVMISYALWKTQFGGDTAVIGKRISFGGRTPWEVIGVMPKGFAFPLPTTDVWLPSLFDRASRTQVFFRRAHWIRVVGRMKEGVTAERANADLQSIVKKLQRQYPATNAQMGAGLTPVREWIVGDTKKPLLILLGASVVLLLIACANVGNLMLVHAVSRAREMSLRFVLGASRMRVVRLALTQSLLLSLIGGVIGLFIGWIGARALIQLQPTGLLPVTDIPLDSRVWFFAIALTTVSGIVFGLAPALMATRQSPADALNAGGRAIAGGGARRWARMLVVGEVALASLLLIGASLLVRSYRNVAAVPVGFDGSGVLTASLGIPASRYDSAAKVVAFYHQLLDRIAAQPGVVSVGAVRQLPATETSWSSSLAVRGRQPMPEGADIVHREVIGDYFEVMRVPLLKGRMFAASDRRLDAPQVVLINKALADKYFPNENPIGHFIANDRVPDSTSTWHEIVGVVGDERQASLVAPAAPEVFKPFEQDWTRAMTVVVRAKPDVDPMSLAGTVRRSVRDLDSLLAITSLRPMTEVHQVAMSRQRFMSVLVFVFAATGVLLAIVGVFGVLVQLVQSRAREMGLRIALGARPQQVSWLVVGNGVRLVVMGVVVGLLIATATTSVMTSLLYGVKATDAASYFAAAAMIIVLGAIATAVPAIRASTADPALTLRAE